MRILLLLLIVRLVHLKSLETKIQLYTFNDSYSTYIVDKGNKIYFDNEKATLNGPISYLYSDENNILIGGNEQVFNLSQKLNSMDTIKIVPNQKLTKGQNYIKVALPLNENILITCGTNLYQCYMNNEPTNLLIDSNKLTNNRNIAPYFYQNSVYFFHLTYSVMEIFKQNFEIETNKVKFNEMIRLPNGAIGNANLRSSYGHDDKVYFFFSESDTNIQNKLTYKTFVSYVGQVCSNDIGKRSFDGITRFITFKKTKINCYLPDYVDMAHAFFTEIQEASKPAETIDEKTGEKTDVFYAIFTSKRSNEIDSAICMYRFSRLKQSMSGLFKNEPGNLPQKPLETCSEYKNLTQEKLDSYYKSITKYLKFEMDDVINQVAFFSIKNSKFTSIAIDDSLENHIIYIGTADGKVIKILKKEQPIILAEIQVFDSTEPVVNIIISKQSKLLTIISEQKVKKISIDQICQSFKTCYECNGAEDPDCAWSNKGCVLNQNNVNLQECSRYESIVFNNEINVKKMTSENGQNQSYGFMFLIFLLTFCVTCLLTCMFTFYIIKRYYKLIEKNEQENERKFMDLFKNKSFRSTLTVKKKLLNCYEKQPVVCVNSRPESTSDSPFILTSSSSSTTTQSNSPNNYAEKIEIYSSEECLKDSNLIRIC